jgi:hypothetical protein
MSKQEQTIRQKQQKTPPDLISSKSVLQRAAVNAQPTNNVPPIVNEVLNSVGQTLDSGTQAFMESRFGRDFSNVRVHTDTRAAESARAVNALAYTVGKDVVFGKGKYAPETTEGKKLLVHELTHVVQQGENFNLSPSLIGNQNNTAESEAAQTARNFTTIGSSSTLAVTHRDNSLSIRRQPLPLSPPQGVEPTARVGMPDYPLPFRYPSINPSDPSGRGEAIGGGIKLGIRVANTILEWINDAYQAKRAQDELKHIIDQIVKNLPPPDMGILVVYHFYLSGHANPETPLTPKVVFDYIEWAMGRNQVEATKNLPRTVRIAKGTPTTSKVQWIPPLLPASSRTFATPFPKLALATFARGRALLEDVSWNGILGGFDNEGVSSLENKENSILHFFILRLPKVLDAFYRGTARIYPKSIPIKEKATAEGGTIPVVDLDPINPFGRVTAACVFPADNPTETLFKTTPPTEDNGRELGYDYFEKVRWVRPENIKIIQRF